MTDEKLEPGVYDYDYRLRFPGDLHPMYGTPRERDVWGQLEISEETSQLTLVAFLVADQVEGFLDEDYEVVAFGFKRVETAGTSDEN